MSRGQLLGLRELIDLQQAGGYTLPDDVLEAYRTHLRLRDLTLDEVPLLHPTEVSGRLVRPDVTPDDVLALAAEIDDAATRRRLTDTASSVRNAAVEFAGDIATTLASDAADQIITDHLRPAFDQVLEQARAAGAKLGNHGLNPRALLRAPKASQDAFHVLEALADRYQAIQTARIKANNVGHRQPQHDVEHMFATFQNPMAFAPDWTPGTARLPRPPFPADPTELLFWLVTDPAAVEAQTWLPTLAEQNAAWSAVFGEVQAQRAAAASNANAMRAMFERTGTPAVGPGVDRPGRD